MRGITAATLLRRFGLPVAVVIGAAALALLAAACRSGGGSSGSDSPQAGGSTRSPSALAFSACMRSHGVHTFPDPDSNGAIPKVTPQQLGVSSSQFQAAQTACEHLLKPNDAQVQLTLSGMLDFARCMRSHGVHDWPDPTTEDGQPVFDLQGRIAPDSPQIAHKSDQCANLLHSAPGQNGTVLCNGIGEDGCHHYG
jgi:hypothetical protein